MNNILNLVSNYVKEILTNHLPDDLVYHNLFHTIDVVETSKLLAEDSNLSQDEIELLLIAAWFHDVGYIEKYEGHEEVSIRIAREFLEKNNYCKEKIDIVASLIESTKNNASRDTISKKILHDADISHIGKKGYQTKSELLRSEFLSRKNEVYSDDEWIEMNLNFISKHDFLSDSAKKLFGTIRLENIQKLQRKISKSNKKKIVGKEKESDSNLKLNQNTGSLIRGVQTIFRITSSNHIDLSSIADHKANIMISICSIILSAVISFGMKYIHGNEKFIIPMLILLFVSLISLILAILSTRPIVTSGFVSREDVLNKKGNLLFFGNFYKMELDDYLWSMRHLMNDTSYLYDTLVRDIYHLGKVLGKKYHYLRLCYTVFMFGMIISVISFIIVYFILV